MHAFGDPQDFETRLASLPAPVTLVFFTQTFGCDTCFAARRVVDQIAALSDRITVEEHNLVLDKEKVAEYGVDRAPALAVVGTEDLGIRYYGVPAGHEIEALVDAIEVVASRRLQAERDDAVCGGVARPLRARAGLRHAHVTVLSPGGQPGLSPRRRQPARHRLGHRSDRVSRSDAPLPGDRRPEDHRR